ncbi:MAG: ATP-dependent DNA helicase RecG [Holosporaceae bacterium]|jgi:ATP-dependent DNA helicase RecG|nr:ATP-dependent DNA helicase RecG [Holosporaceae bacterium]
MGVRKTKSVSNFPFQPFTKFVKLSEFASGLIKKCCGGNRVIDLLLHVPYSIVRRSDDINNFSGRDKLTVVVKITDHVIPKHKSAPYKVIGLNASEDVISIIYFNYNIHYIKKTLPIGASFVVSGSAQKTADGISIIHPDVVAPPATAKYHLGLEPIYPLVARLSNRTLIYVIGNLLKILPEIPEWMPRNFMKKHGLMPFSEALRGLHRPKEPEDLTTNGATRRRIAVDELLANQIRLRQMRSLLKSHSVPIFQATGMITKDLHLPFDLTPDQRACLEDIKNDLASGKPMNRLIQGDVGSGKTVVALMAMLWVLENDAQAALLAPTEILAMQHRQTMEKLLGNLGLRIDVMLSSNRKIREEQIHRLKSGATQILIGTHAILEDNVEFYRLGLVVIDEQHKFGVEQRLSLIKKTECPNVLAMSATPIPRTLLLGCYGDLDISTIRTKPAGRIPIQTTVVGISKIDALIARLKEIDSQIYWVCPVIEESESLVDINTRCEYLRRAFPDLDVGILHGKMKPREKEAIIDQFKNGELKLLASTTVIEVGVDVPKANVMVIEHAERFGLAQMHQLRGRVGRGLDASHCVLLYHHPISQIGRQRLQLLRDTADGFLLSEEDLKLRGAGDILGREQSGFYSLRFSDYAYNHGLLKIAEEAAALLESNPAGAALLCRLFNRLEFVDFCN